MQVQTISSTVNALLQELRTLYTAATATLDAERAALEADSQKTLKTAHELRLPLPAQAREAQRQADKLLLAGKPEEADAKYALQRLAERAPAEMERRASAISARLWEIVSEKKVIARHVFQEWLPRFREALVEEQRTMCDGLDLAWEGVQRFALETGIQLAGGTSNDLTAREHGPEKVIFERLMNWFGRWGRK